MGGSRGRGGGVTYAAGFWRIVYPGLPLLTPPWTIHQGAGRWTSKGHSYPPAVPQWGA